MIFLVLALSFSNISRTAGGLGCQTNHARHPFAGCVCSSIVMMSPITPHGGADPHVIAFSTKEGHVGVGLRRRAAAQQNAELSSF